MYFREEVTLSTLEMMQTDGFKMLMGCLWIPTLIILGMSIFIHRKLK